MTTNNRLWLIGSILLSVAIVAMGWFIGVSPKLSEAANASTQLATVEAQNVVHEAEVVAIKKQYEQLPALQAELATLREAVPADDQLSTFLGELHSLEQKNDVSVTDFTASDGQEYAPIESTVPALNITNPMITKDNFVAIKVDVEVSGENANVMNFIEGLQTGERLFLVTDLALNQGASGSSAESGGGGSASAKATISGLVYVLLDKPPTPKAGDAKTAEAATAPKG